MLNLKVSGLDKRIQEVEAWIGQRDELSNIDYENYLEEYEKLLALKKERRNSEGKGERKRIDPNTLVSSAVTLLGVMMMLEYEKTDVISTKSMNVVNKLFK